MGTVGNGRFCSVLVVLPRKHLDRRGDGSPLSGTGSRGFCAGFGASNVGTAIRCESPGSRAGRNLRINSPPRRKIEDYNTVMKRMMSNPYEYHHDLGMNYTVITDNLIVGSQPQTPEDIDHLEEENVGHILCLQQDRDIEYWGIDFESITERCKKAGVHHMRKPAKDFAETETEREGNPRNDSVAGGNAEGEAGAGRLHLFLSSVFSSLFGQNQNQQEQQEEEEAGAAMATRHHHQVPAPQQQRGGGGGGGGMKQQKAADGNNRRALGDIGNLVHANARPVEGKPPPQISRPVTRSFGAQLRNTQMVVDPSAAVAAKKTVKPDAAAAGKGVVRPAKPRAAAAKPKPETVIEISPDTGKKGSTTSKKKRVHTLTSVLTARSKAACGISEKPAEPAHDIDAADLGDQLAVADYVEDIYNFYKISENSRRPGDYMDSQTEINTKMRAILADWLIEVHDRFELMPETLYLAFYIIDRYLSVETVLRRELQLVGATAMLIACKYEEIWAPEVNDFICISDRAYSRDQILAKEKGILDKLEWNLTVPTPYVFLVRFLKAAKSDQELEHMVFFFAELGLMQYSIVSYCPSMVAASAVYAARCTLNRSPLWNETLKRHTGFSEQQLMDCAKLLVGFHSSATESKLKVVYKKYSSPELSSVALHRPASKLLEDSKVEGDAPSST